MTQVSVVVATRNRKKDLVRCIRSLNALPERPPVLVVDNGSEDGSADALAGLEPSVRIIRAGRNLGAVGRNLGALACDTPYIAFCDDDSSWDPGSLAMLESLFESYPRLALVCGRILVGQQADIDPVCAQMAQAVLGTEPDLPGPPILGFVACGAAVRRSAFLEVGGFSPILGFGGEEQLLALDLASRGWGLSYVPSVVARHFPSPLREASEERAARWMRNDLLTSWLRRPARVAARSTLELAGQGLRKAPARRACLEAIASLPKVLANRRRVPDEIERELRLLAAAG